MASYLRQAAIVVVLVLIGFLFWSYKPRRLNEPYLHYAAEQWRTLQSGNLLERESRSVIGTAALDCGRVPLKGSASGVNNCITRMRDEKRAFMGRWELPGIDAVVEEGLLGTADGRLYHFQYLEGPFVPNWRSVRIRECRKPVMLKADSITGVLDCETVTDPLRQD